MKFPVLILTLATGAALVAGCQYPNGEPNNTGTGALAGGAIGAASGAMIGGHRNSGPGALIGAAVGAIAGGIIGSSMDDEQRERLRHRAPQTYARVEQGQPLATADVKALAQAGVSDDIIIAQIHNSRTIYHLSAADIVDLHDSGVNDRVIDVMINTANNAGTTTTVVETAPPAAPVPSVVVSPQPGYVWMDGEWEWRNGEWAWVSGRWVLPPFPGAIWIHGTWYHGPRGWYHSPGHWRR